MAAADDDAPVPRLPRGRMIKLSVPMVVRILLTLTLLVMIVVIQKPCSEGVSRFVTGFGDGSGSGAAAGSGAPVVETPELRPEDYEPITSDMSPEEVQAAMNRARAKADAKAKAGSGSGSE